jgi:hypothetical protein
MIEITDPLARLRAANPEPPTEVALVEPDPVLFRSITAADTAPPAPVRRERLRRPARRFVPALVVTSLLGGAVGYAVLRGEVTKPVNAACYESADLGAATDVARVGREGPAAACAELWRRGVFGPVTEVPPLTECTLPSGGVAVFPVTAGAPNPCAGLDLPPVARSTTVPAPATAPADSNSRVLAFHDAVVPQFLGATCVTRQEGTEIVRRELDRAGLAGWTVMAEGFTPERPCATLSIQADIRRVTLVPGPPRR